MSPRTHMDDDYKPLFGAAISPWYRAFAWWPVQTVDRGYVWLRVIHKRRIQKYTFLDGGADFWFQYAVTVREERRS